MHIILTDVIVIVIRRGWFWPIQLILEVLGIVDIVLTSLSSRQCQTFFRKFGMNHKLEICEGYFEGQAIKECKTYQLTEALQSEFESILQMHCCIRTWKKNIYLLWCIFR